MKDFNWDLERSTL